MGITARRLHGRHKSKAIVLGNLALAHVRQRDVEQAATVLHRQLTYSRYPAAGAA
jgi:hypothetical protein